MNATARERKIENNRNNWPENLSIVVNPTPLSPMGTAHIERMKQSPDASDEETVRADRL